MITVKIPRDNDFRYQECKELYKSVQGLVNDDDFDDVIKRTLFYAFHITTTDELIGCIYYYKRENQLFVNAFAKRGHHLLNLECFKESLNWFDCDIYAHSTEKTSILCLLRCGFKKYKNNIYRRIKNER